MSTETNKGDTSFEELKTAIEKVRDATGDPSFSVSDKYLEALKPDEYKNRFLDVIRRYIGGNPELVKMVHKQAMSAIADLVSESHTLERKAFAERHHFIESKFGVLYNAALLTALDGKYEQERAKLNEEQVAKHDSEKGLKEQIVLLEIKLERLKKARNTVIRESQTNKNDEQLKLLADIEKREILASRQYDELISKQYGIESDVSQREVFEKLKEYVRNKDK